MHSPASLILIGFKSCGKTSLGKLYCQKNPQYKFIDTDDLIRLNYNNCSIGEVYELMGDKAFRELEANIIADLVKIRDTGNLIIATGGGGVLNPKNILNLKKIGKIIYLKCAPEVIRQRWASNNINPSFIRSDYTFESYIQDRSKVYCEAADQIIDVTNLNQTEVCDFGE